MSVVRAAVQAGSNRLLFVYIAVYCLLWSGAFIAGKAAVAYCPPTLLLAMRFALAGLLIFIIAAARGMRWNLSRRDVVVFVFLGLFNNAFYLSLSYFGFQTISAGLSALIISTNPVLTALLATMFLGERLTWRKVSGLLLGFAGVVFIVADRVSLGVDGLSGVGFTVGALLGMVAGTILYKLLAPAGNLWIANGIQNAAAGLVLMPFAFAFSSLSEIVPSWQFAAAFAFLVLGVSIFAYLIWFHLLDVCGATAASAYHFLMPPLGILFGWLILGEHITARDMLGIIPVVIGIYLVTRAPVAVPTDEMSS